MTILPIKLSRLSWFPQWYSTSDPQCLLKVLQTGLHHLNKEFHYFSHIIPDVNLLVVCMSKVNVRKLEHWLFTRCEFSSKVQKQLPKIIKICGERYLPQTFPKTSPQTPPPPTHTQLPSEKASICLCFALKICSSCENDDTPLEKKTHFTAKQIHSLAQGGVRSWHKEDVPP